jgi:large subunit ribosomal protein L18
MNKWTSPRITRREKIKKRIRKRIHGTSERPRLVVSRSLKNISAQLIDDTQGRTICTIASLSSSIKDQTAKAKGKVEAAKMVGKAIGEEAKKHNILRVVFDRNGYLYHGRVKAVADGAREAGLQF